jgi:hypothetical protein
LTHSRTEALSAGYYTSPGWGQNYLAIQILTIADLLDKSKKVNGDMPPQHGTFKQVQKATHDDEATQAELFEMGEQKR